MKMENMKKSYDEITSTNKLLLLSVVFLSIAVSLLVMYQATRHTRIVMVPPYIDKRLEVSWNSANQAYYKSMGLQIANMIGNVTPQTIRFVTDSLALYMSKDVYAQVKPQLSTYAEDESFKRGTTFSYFTPQSVRYEDKVDKVFVTGHLVTTPMVVNPGQNRAVSKIVTYEMAFIMNNGRPIVTAFDSYEGNRIHSQEWLRKNEKVLEAKNKAEEGAKN